MDRADQAELGVSEARKRAGGKNFSHAETEGRLQAEGDSHFRDEFAHFIPADEPRVLMAIPGPADIGRG